VAIAADLVVTALVVLADVPDLAAVPPSETVPRVPAALVAPAAHLREVAVVEGVELTTPPIYLPYQCPVRAVVHP
jgi:hypothetical protein